MGQYDINNNVSENVVLLLIHVPITTNVGVTGTRIARIAPGYRRVDIGYYLARGTRWNSVYIYVTIACGIVIH